MFGPGELAITGLCMMPALLLNQDTCGRIIQFLFFFFLAWLCGKKNNILATVSLMLGIIFFNLLVPYGEILFSAGPLKITHGALMGGIRRAVTLEALFMLSRCCVRRDLVLPGTFGRIAGESLRIFSAAAEDGRLTKSLAAKPGNLAERMDRLLISLEEIALDGEKLEQAYGCKPVDRSARPCGGRPDAGGILPRLILAAAVLLAWLPLIWERLS
jgi:heptaprenyl diphosphate synthase